MTAPDLAATGRPRRRLLLLVACATTLALLAVGGIVGGIAYLVLDRRADEASRTTVETEYFSFEHPSSWRPVAPTVTETAEEQVLTVESPDGTRRLVLLEFRDGSTPEETCEMQEELVDQQGLGTHQNEIVGEREVDGRTAIHHRSVARGVAGEFSSTVIDTLCLPTPEGSVALVAQSISRDDDADTMPELDTILASWTWTEEEDYA